jgi:ABC-type glutathione transport system ATPase component
VVDGSSSPQDRDDAIDDDVAREAQRVGADGRSSSDMIKIVDVWKYYGLNRAVKSMFLGIDAGECFGLLGPNGAGKRFDNY